MVKGQRGVGGGGEGKGTCGRGQGSRKGGTGHWRPPSTGKAWVGLGWARPELLSEESSEGLEGPEGAKRFDSHGNGQRRSEGRPVAPASQERARVAQGNAGAVHGARKRHQCQASRNGKSVRVRRSRRPPGLVARGHTNQGADCAYTRQ
jgi:hypothetical protein